MTLIGPRIYNLFPLLAGALDGWHHHLDRIRSMEFDWVYVNPFQYPGFSGSLYAIKDFHRLHPVIQGDSDASAKTLVHGFTEAARSRGLRVMADLVINHTAKDALLVQEHPEWYVREPDGELRSPRAVDPVDPRKVTVWGDLAEIDYGRPGYRQAQIEWWAERVRELIAQGFSGFRCDAAYQVPSEVWQELIARARDVDPDLVFAAETLGCTPEQVIALGDAGFDLMFNSSKWWDFRSDWLLDQYDMYRRVAPTVAFPESHDTERLAAERADLGPQALESLYRFRYLFAATFSAGVMMPMGFEYGAAKRLDVVTSRPGDWHWEAERHPRFDLTDFVRDVNHLKAGVTALGIEGPLSRLSAPDAPALALYRTPGLGGEDRSLGHGAALVVLNPDEHEPAGIDASQILTSMDLREATVVDRTPGAEPVAFEPGTRLTLAPLEARVFVPGSDAMVRHHGSPKLPSRTVSERTIHRLAQQRIAIEKVTPEIDAGRHPVKRVTGDVLEVECDAFGDGHDKIRVRLMHRRPRERTWQPIPMEPLGNDRWRGRIPLARIGRHAYTIEAWYDEFGQWREELVKKHDAGVPISLELEEGRLMVEAAREHTDVTEDREILSRYVDAFAAAGGDGDRLAVMLEPELAETMLRAEEETNLSAYGKELEVVIDRPAARFAAWYEMFPRSQSGDPKRHGTFRDVIRRLPYVANMGFDVLYFTPIHPIGRTNRKGRNNTLVAGPDDPGSPYATGSAEGGHTALHPELGTFEDFHALVAAAHDHGIEIALDFAIQASPDHPWLSEHPEWFDWRPDGSIKYAENPPKKYEDIVNVHFYGGGLPSLWFELRDTILFWCGHGIRTFRVDNPHTKPFPFWEWMIGEVKSQYPDAIFLSEAFTRPKVMKKLAKLGFSQSYTYFTWRNEKWELIEYLTELTRTEAREFFRPNFFTNTPDINPAILQTSEPAAYKMRFVLAATLAGVYGIYNGFEIAEGTPYPGKEEYLDSEKYEIRVWDFDRPGNLQDYIRRVNVARRANPALHDHLNLLFLNAWNDNILAYAKFTPSRDNAVMVAVNLDHRTAQEARFEVPLWEFGLRDDASIDAVDLFTGDRRTFHGKVQHLRLDPAENPCALWRLIPPGQG